MNCVFFAVCTGLTIGFVVGLIWPDSIVLTFQRQTKCTIVATSPSNFTCCDPLNTDCSECTLTMVHCEMAMRDHIEGYCCASTRCCKEWDEDECDEWGQSVQAIMCGTCSDIDYFAEFNDGDTKYQRQFSAHCSRDNFDCYRYYTTIGNTMECWYDIRNPQQSVSLSPVVYKWWQFLLVILAGCYSFLFILGGFATLVPMIVSKVKTQMKNAKRAKESEAKMRQMRQQAHDLEVEQEVFRTYVDVRQEPS